jgi:hypothetical protein
MENLATCIDSIDEQTGNANDDNLSKELKWRYSCVFTVQFFKLLTFMHLDVNMDTMTQIKHVKQIVNSVLYFSVLDRSTEEFQTEYSQLKFEADLCMHSRSDCTDDPLTTFVNKFHEALQTYPDLILHVKALVEEKTFSMVCVDLTYFIGALARNDMFALLDNARKELRKLCNRLTSDSSVKEVENVMAQYLCYNNGRVKMNMMQFKRFCTEMFIYEASAVDPTPYAKQEWTTLQNKQKERHCEFLLHLCTQVTSVSKMHDDSNSTVKHMHNVIREQLRSLSNNKDEDIKSRANELLQNFTLYHVENATLKQDALVNSIQTLTELSPKVSSFLVFFDTLFKGTVPKNITSFILDYVSDKGSKDDNVQVLQLLCNDSSEPVLNQKLLQSTLDKYAFEQEAQTRVSPEVRLEKLKNEFYGKTETDQLTWMFRNVSNGTNVPNEQIVKSSDVLLSGMPRSQSIDDWTQFYFANVHLNGCALTQLYYVCHKVDVGTSLFAAMEKLLVIFGLKKVTVVDTQSDLATITMEDVKHFASNLFDNRTVIQHVAINSAVAAFKVAVDRHQEQYMQCHNVEKTDSYVYSSEYYGRHPGIIFCSTHAYLMVFMGMLALFPRFESDLMCQLVTNILYNAVGFSNEYMDSKDNLNDALTKNMNHDDMPSVICWDENNPDASVGCIDEIPGVGDEKAKRETFVKELMADLMLSNITKLVQVSPATFGLSIYLPPVKHLQHTDHDLTTKVANVMRPFLKYAIYYGMQWDPIPDLSCTDEITADHEQEQYDSGNEGSSYSESETDTEDTKKSKKEVEDETDTEDNQNRQDEDNSDSECEKELENQPFVVPDDDMEQPQEDDEVDDGVQTCVFKTAILNNVGFDKMRAWWTNTRQTFSRLLFSGAFVIMNENDFVEFFQTMVTRIVQQDEEGNDEKVNDLTSYRTRNSVHDGICETLNLLDKLYTLLTNIQNIDDVRKDKYSNALYIMAYICHLQVLLLYFSRLPNIGDGSMGDHKTKMLRVIRHLTGRTHTDNLIALNDSLPTMVKQIIKLTRYVVGNTSEDKGFNDLERFQQNLITKVDFSNDCSNTANNFDLNLQVLLGQYDTLVKLFNQVYCETRQWFDSCVAKMPSTLSLYTKRQEPVAAEDSANVTSESTKPDEDAISAHDTQISNEDTDKEVWKKLLKEVATMKLSDDKANMMTLKNLVDAEKKIAKLTNCTSILPPMVNNYYSKMTIVMTSLMSSSFGDSVSDPNSRFWPNNATIAAFVKNLSNVVESSNVTSFLEHVIKIDHMGRSDCPIALRNLIYEIIETDLVKLLSTQPATFDRHFVTAIGTLGLVHNMQTLCKLLTDDGVYTLEVMSSDEAVTKERCELINSQMNKLVKLQSMLCELGKSKNMLCELLDFKTLNGNNAVANTKRPLSCDQVDTMQNITKKQKNDTEVGTTLPDSSNSHTKSKKRSADGAELDYVVDSDSTLGVVLRDNDLVFEEINETFKGAVLHAAGELNIQIPRDAKTSDCDVTTCADLQQLCNLLKVKIQVIDCKTATYEMYESNDQDDFNVVTLAVENETVRGIVYNRHRRVANVELSSDTN